MKEDSSAYRTAKERITAYLLERNMRESVVRDMVLSLICQLPQPFTATSLQEVCVPEHISKATIYNALHVFIEAGVVQKYERRIGQTLTEYELVTKGRSRLQIICCNCGRRAVFNDQAFTRLVLERKYTNFNPQRFSMIVYGECKICRRKRKSRKRK